MLTAPRQNGSSPSTAGGGCETLSEDAFQMVLGTLLGDACMSWNKTGRYHARHGMAQAAYCDHKAELLAPWIGTPPKTVVNRGWGEFSRIFTTLSSTAFDRFRVLCYPAGRKRVTQGWLNALTWRGLAYWYMDDGGLTAESRLVINTQGFIKSECQLLADTLTERGCQTSVQPVLVRGATRYVLTMPVEYARIFLARIEPYMHETLKYKLKISQPVLLRCSHCGVEFTAQTNQAAAKFPICGAEKCVLAANRRRNKKYLVGDKLAQKRTRSREMYAANLAANRKSKREDAARRRRENPEKYRAYKRAWRARRKGQNLSQA